MGNECKCGKISNKNNLNTKDYKDYDCGCSGNPSKNSIMKVSKAPGFYMAVCDVEEHICKAGESFEKIYSHRYFNDKFVDTPEKALLFAFDSENERWKIDPEKILKDVKYDPNAKEYVRKTILTTNGHTPTAKQMEKILNGTYEYILLIEYVQVFETNLIATEGLVAKSIKKWRERTGLSY